MNDAHWTIEDLPWDRLKPESVSPDLLKVIKAAALVEYNANAYADYLCKVFNDDPEFQRAAWNWALEEVQHGTALGLWAEKIDPAWSLERAMKKFREGYKVEHFVGGVSASVRGSRCGELVARCLVETATSSYYTAIQNSCDEPVLKEICKKIAGDEFRHYKLFYDFLGKYLKQENLGRIGRIKVALGRISEGEDDELAYAFFAANANDNEEYDRDKYSIEYLGRAYSYYKKPEVDRAVSMIFKACGFRPQSLSYRLVSSFALWKLEAYTRKIQKKAA